MLTIRETQQQLWHDDGTLTVTSEPVLDFVGGSKFTTAAEFTVQPEGSGCKVPPIHAQRYLILQSCTCHSRWSFYMINASCQGDAFAFLAAAHSQVID
jgi:hypothetical protein